MEKVIIVAKSDNNVIGKDGELAWDMPADEDFFLHQIKGCYLLSGRRSYESSQGKKIFNGKDFVIVTRQKGYQAEGGKIAHSVDEAIATAETDGAQRLCILGGGEIYRQSMKKADRLIVTEIHVEIPDGDAFFPEIDPHYWKEYKRENHPKDELNPYPFSFVYYARIRP